MRKYHRKLAALLYIPLIWFAVTGPLAGLKRWIRDGRFPYRAPSETMLLTPAAPNSLARILEAPELQTRLSDVRGIRFAHPGSDESDQVLFTSGEKWFHSPLTRQWIARMTPADGDAVSFLTRLHRGKVLGTPGRAIFTALGILLLAVSVTGLWLARFSRLSRLKPGARRDHHWLGTLTGVPLLLMLLTGAVWNFSEELRGQAIAAPMTTPTAANFPLALTRASQAYPDSSAEGIYLVKGKTLVLFRDAGRVYLTDSTTEVFRPWNPRGLLELCSLIHTGAIWGDAGIWLICALSLMILGLTLSGLRMIFR